MSPNPSPQPHDYGQSPTHQLHTSKAILPAMESLRIDSEEAVWWGMVDAFLSEFPNHRWELEERDHSSHSRSFELSLLIDLISQGNNTNLLSTENKFRLAELGADILGASDNFSVKRLGWNIKNELRALRSSDEDPVLNDWWINPDNLAEWPPQIQKTTMSVGEPLNLNYFDIEKANRPAVWAAAMRGLLTLRIIAFGFGPQEEEALSKLGGNPEAFRFSVKQHCDQQPEEQHKPFFPNLTSSAQIEGPADSQVLNHELTTLESAVKCRLDFSSRFDGLTREQVAKQLIKLDEKTRRFILHQLDESHARIQEEPAAEGERRIIRGTSVWASNLREHLPALTHLNHLNLSALDLSNTILAGKKMSHCRFEGSDLSGAMCLGTDFGHSLFGTAEGPANLSRAFIARANLRGADLSEANLSHIRWDYLIDKDGAEFEAAEAPLIDRTTRFLPLSWDQTSNPNDAEIKVQARRFEGWTPHQFKVIQDSIGPLQRMAIKRLEKCLRQRAQKSLILPQRNPLGSAGEFTPDVVLGEINSAELHTALTSLPTIAESARLPLIKGDHHNADLTDQARYPLRGSFIEGASLVDATMSNQQLQGAVIGNSDLSGINLRGADLTDALLVNVNLTGADLRGIILTGARLVNCNLDGVLLDQVTMVETQMQQCTMANVTIREGVIADLFVCQSDLHNISFSGDQTGKGLIIGGIGLVDSIMINAQFSGNTSVKEIELLGSLAVGSGPGILSTANLIISPESEWRDQMIQIVADSKLGDISYELSAERIEQHPPSRERQPGRNIPKGSFLTTFLLQERVSRNGSLMASVPLLEHLATQKIGFQVREMSRIDAAQKGQRLILPTHLS